MDKPDSPATDEAAAAAASRPVSSLRSHFEALKPVPKPKSDALRGSSLVPAAAAATTPTPTTTTTTTAPVQLPPRASSDLPHRPFGTRSASLTFNGSLPNDSHDQSSSTAVQSKDRRSVSPPKSAQHRHSRSLVTPASPQMTPSFRVDSPSSPSRGGQLYGLPTSHSPERIDTTPFAKVRELISQHSSRNVSPNPASSRVDKPALPPPVNRSDKPKIPAVPAKLASLPTPTNTSLLAASLSVSPSLQPQTARRSSEAQRISPFSTPPSSDGSPSPGSSPRLTAHAALAAAAGENSRQNDARFMGFQQRPAKGAERRDPRTMGLSVQPTAPSAAPSSQSRDLNASPARASTVSERRPSGRDARTLGLSQADSRPQQRHVSESLSRSRSPAMAIPAPAAAAAAPQPIKIGTSATRDARTLGFSGASAGLSRSPGPRTEEADSTGRPRRPTIRAPPPSRLLDGNASSSSTNSISNSNIGTVGTTPRKIRQPSPIPDRATKPAPSPQIAATRAQALPPLQRIAKAPVDSQFLPPPKRNGGEAAPVDSRPRVSADRPRVGRPLTRAVVGSDSDEAEPAAAAAATAAAAAAAAAVPEPTPAHKAEYPDANNSNRRPPLFHSGLQGLPVKLESRAFDVCGSYLCVAGFMTKVFDITTGEQLSAINHGDTIRANAVRFKPAADMASEGKRIWIGNNAGDLQEIDVSTHTVIAEDSSHNRSEIVRILRCGRDLWTLDNDGKLFVWPADESGTPNLKYSHISHRVPKGHTFSLVVRDRLWLATGREVRVYRPGSEPNFAPLTKALAQAGTGDITSGATSEEDDADRVYFGHADGRVTIYSTRDYACLGNIKASDYKINGLVVSGTSLWAAFKTGKIYVYDVSTWPWKVQKDWRAHAGPIIGLTLDPKSIWTMQRMQITSIGHDGQARFWDGLLEDDWMEQSMQADEASYCTFRHVRAAVVTWNCGACTPNDVRTDFIADAIHADEQQPPPEIIAFGFQEVVDLEDRAVTAKSIFGFGKKKDVDSTEQHQSRVYRDWRDYLSLVIGRSTAHAYSELHTSSLIGLFQCIFIRQEERARLRNVQATNIKCGMKGHYGNKGGLVTRFILDDTSLCFINCHLAAGQTQTSHRNNDLATILESENLAPEPDAHDRLSLFTGGGDGSQILDHEVCILNGDLNYRIDTVPRDTVIKLIRANDLARLLERDQIMLSRRRVSGFRLASFVEMPIAFAPTYKYDVGTDNYDSSEKKRSPAWCDRILYRGAGGGAVVKQLEYRRHDGVRVSDHRPVSGLFTIRLKTVDAARRARAWKQCEAAFDRLSKARMQSVAENWLVREYGVSRQEAARALQH